MRRRAILIVPFLAAILITAQVLVVRGADANEEDRFSATPRSDSVAETSARAVAIGQDVFVATNHEEGREATVRVFRVTPSAGKLAALPDPTNKKIDDGAPIAATEFNGQLCVSFLIRSASYPTLTCFNALKALWTPIEMDEFASAKHTFVGDIASRGGKLWAMLIRLRRPNGLATASFDGKKWTDAARLIRHPGAAAFFEDRQDSPPSLSLAYGNGGKARRAIFQLHDRRWVRSTVPLNNSFGATLSGSVPAGGSKHMFANNSSLPSKDPWRFSVAIADRKSASAVKPGRLNQTHGDAQGGLWRIAGGSVWAAWVEEDVKRASRAGVPQSLYVARVSASGSRVNSPHRVWKGLGSPFFPLQVVALGGKPYVLFGLPQGARHQGSRLALIGVDDPSTVISY